MVEWGGIEWGEGCSEGVLEGQSVGGVGEGGLVHLGQLEQQVFAWCSTRSGRFEQSLRTGLRFTFE
jgi:hypothetical protein